MIQPSGHGLQNYCCCHWALPITSHPCQLHKGTFSSERVWQGRQIQYGQKFGNCIPDSSNPDITDSHTAEEPNRMICFLICLLTAVAAGDTDHRAVLLVCFWNFHIQTLYKNCCQMSDHYVLDVHQKVRRHIFKQVTDGLIRIWIILGGTSW